MEDSRCVSISSERHIQSKEDLVPDDSCQHHDLSKSKQTLTKLPQARNLEREDSHAANGACEQNNNAVSEMSQISEHVQIGPREAPTYSSSIAHRSKKVIQNVITSAQSTPTLEKTDVNNHAISSDDPIPADSGKNQRFPSSSRTLLIVCCLTDFLSQACCSLHAPFYPRVADRKGASLTEVGLVFGVFQLTVFIMSLVFGSLLPRIGAKKLAITGVITMAVSAVLFGFLDNVVDVRVFVALSIVIRILQANGNAAFVTASFSIAAAAFPSSVAKAISYIEMAAGVGLIVGPAVGGGLYAVGGFTLPFLVMGMLLLGAGGIAAVVIPDVQAEAPSGKGMFSMLSIPSVSSAAFTVFAAAAAIGFLLPTLEPHVRLNFELPAHLTGLIFVIDGITYALCNPFWGWLCDRFRVPRLISLMGSTFILVSFGLIGPVSVLPWLPNIWVTCAACALLGFGLGATFVSGFIQALSDATKGGFPDDLRTYGLVSGMWISMLSLGSFVGTSSGGFLTEKFGFTNGLYFVIALQALVMLTTFGFVLNQHKGFLKRFWNMKYHVNYPRANFGSQVVPEHYVECVPIKV